MPEDFKQFIDSTVASPEAFFNFMRTTFPMFAWGCVPRPYNILGMWLIQRAYYKSAAMHEGETRKSGEPYVTHPMAVSVILVCHYSGARPSHIAAALLHDTVEDTAGSRWWAYVSILCISNPLVVLLVWMLTKEKIDTEDLEPDATRDAKNIRDRDYRRRMKTGTWVRYLSKRLLHIVWRLKIADTYHNGSSIEVMLPVQRARWYRLARHYYAQFADEIGFLSTELNALIEANKPLYEANTAG